MSQFWQGVTAGSLPPTVPTSFVTDDGTAIPSGNVLNVFGGFTDENDNNGIATRAFFDLSNNLFINLTNRLRSQTTTNNATPLALTSYLPTVVGTYFLQFDIAAYNTTSSLGATYKVFVGIIFDGANSTKLNLEDKVTNEQAGMSACDVDISISGGLVILRVTGLAGATINWNTVGNYVFAGA